MGFSLAYLIQELFAEVYRFINHYYIGGSKYIFSKVQDFFRDIDYYLALGITVRHFFEPLYGDYSIVGRILGIIFRSIRVIIALVIYVILSIIVFFIYLLWIFFPLIIISKILKNGR